MHFYDFETGHRNCIIIITKLCPILTLIPAHQTLIQQSFNCLCTTAGIRIKNTRRMMGIWQQWYMIEFVRQFFVSVRSPNICHLSKICTKKRFYMVILVRTKWTKMLNQKHFFLKGKLCYLAKIRECWVSRRNSCEYLIQYELFEPITTNMY